MMSNKKSHLLSSRSPNVWKCQFSSPMMHFFVLICEMDFVIIILWLLLQDNVCAMETDGRVPQKHGHVQKTVFPRWSLCCLNSKILSTVKFCCLLASPPWRKTASVCLCCWRKVTRWRPNLHGPSPCTAWLCRSSNLLSSLSVSSNCSIHSELFCAAWWLSFLPFPLWLCDRYRMRWRVLCQKPGGRPGER